MYSVLNKYSAFKVSRVSFNWKKIIKIFEVHRIFKYYLLKTTKSYQNGKISLRQWKTDDRSSVEIGASRYSIPFQDDEGDDSSSCIFLLREKGEH